MAKIFIGSKIIPKKNPIKELIRCCSCHKYYDFKGNIFSSIKGKILICPYCGLQHKVGFELFKNKIDNLIKINRLNLGAIDIGTPAVTAGQSCDSATMVNSINPANASGTITTVEIWARSGYDLVGCRVAIFYVVSGNNLSTRDTEYIGSVIGGSKQAFSVNLDVEIGDYIGIYYTAGKLRVDAITGNGRWVFYGNAIPCTDITFELISPSTLRLYGTGTTPPKNATGKSSISTSIISILSRGKIENASAKASLTSGIIGILSRGKIENASGKSDIVSGIIISFSRGKIEIASGKSSLTTIIDTILSRGKIESITGKSSIDTSVIMALSRGIVEDASGKSSIDSIINILLSKGKIENANGKADITSDMTVALDRGIKENVSGIASITTSINILLPRTRNTSGKGQFDTNIDIILNRIISMNGKATLDTLCDIILNKAEIIDVNGKAYIYISFNANLLSERRALGKADINSLINISTKRTLKGNGKSIFDTLIETKVSRQLIFTQATLDIISNKTELNIER